MLRKVILATGTVLVMATPGLAAEWIAVKGGDSCFASDRNVEPGEAKLGGPYATEAEANEAIKSFPECDSVNLNLDPDDEGGPDK